jgi:hypothetical protein
MVTVDFAKIYFEHMHSGIENGRNVGSMSSPSTMLAGNFGFMVKLQNSLLI